jgi:hypothetical protein
MKKFLLFLTLLFVFNHSYSQSKRPEGKSCNSREGRIQFIQDYSSTYYDWILKKVERVPPDIERYLTEEYRDSILSENNSRFQKVVNNEYYFPWRLRDSIQKFNEELRNGYVRQLGYGSFKKDPHESEILYYTNLLFKSSDVIESYDEYRIFDRRRQKPYFDGKDDGYKRGFSRGIYKVVIEDLISCSFKK